MTRQEANRKILELLSKEVEAKPDFRFNQILINLGMTQTQSGSYYQQTYETLDYHEEPVVTLKRISKE